MTLLVALSLIDANVSRTISATLPAKAPNLFFLDIPSRDSARFRDYLHAEAPAAKIEDVPMMRGRIVA